MLIYTVGNLIETFSYGSIAALYVGRLVAGIGIGCLTVIGPMAIVEIAPSTTRGLMTLWFNVCMLTSQMIGIFVVFGCKKHISVSQNLQYQVPFFVQCFVPAIGILMSFFLYESPRWLCIKDRHEEARKVLLKIRGLAPDHPYIVAEWDAMTRQVAHEQAEWGTLSTLSVVKETFTVRANLRRVQLVIMAYIFAQFSGESDLHLVLQHARVFHRLRFAFCRHNPSSPLKITADFGTLQEQTRLPTICLRSLASLASRVPMSASMLPVYMLWQRRSAA